jgi:hypothetical protein
MFQKPKPKTKLELAFDQALSDMQNHASDTKEYEIVLNRVQTLHKMKEAEKPSRVSADTWVLAGTNILGIAMILVHENSGLITSKALSFVHRAR